METSYWILILLGITIIAIFVGYYTAYLKGNVTINGLIERERLLSEQLESTKKDNNLFLDKLERRLSDAEQEKEKLAISLSQKSTENLNLIERLKEQKSDLEELNTRFKKEFENLAQKILDDKSQKFAQQNKTNIEGILNPLKEKIKDFESKIEVSHKESIAKNASLKQQIEDLSKLNERINQEAKNLTQALKGDQKMQGNWGEVILERLLEKSGLTKDLEYFTQKSYTDESGKRFQPDVVIQLPENKSIIIDSKISLVAYERYFNEEDESQKSQHLKNHITSVKAHIKSLSDKKYQNLYNIQTLDFVLLFIPIESAFSTTIQNDAEIFNDAFTKNIVIVSPSTLLATLRTISSIWKLEYQNRNALEIARQSGALYDKFVGFTEDLITLGKNIDRSKSDYANAMNKLTEGRGNLVRSIEKIKKLGADASKSISPKLVERANEKID